MDVNIQRGPVRYTRPRNFKNSIAIQFCRGLSLVELMVTLAVSVILLAIGSPAFHAILGTTSLSAEVNSLSASLALARSEAIKRGAQVIVCKSRDGEHCSSKGAWSDGWIVYSDDNWNRARDSEERLFFVRDKLPGRVRLSYKAFPTGNYIAYRPGGFSKMNGTFTFCVDGQPDLGRAIIVSWTGRPRLSNTLRDGSALNCEG